MPRFKLVFFSPTKDTSRILNHIIAKFPQNAGKIGDYESCAFVTRGTGQFRPGPEANPAIGTRGELEFVEEDRVEVAVNDKGQSEEVKGVIQELKAVCFDAYDVVYTRLTHIDWQVHPYEEVAYDVYRLEEI